MKGDFTRKTFKSDKHYSGVRPQQGRVHRPAVDDEARYRFTSGWRSAILTSVPAAGELCPWSSYSITTFRFQ